MAAGRIRRPKRLNEDLERPSNAALVLPDFIDLKKDNEFAKPVRRKKNARDDLPEMAIRRKGSWNNAGVVVSFEVGDLRMGKSDSAKRWEVTMNKAANPRSPWRTQHQHPIL